MNVRNYIYNQFHLNFVTTCRHSSAMLTATTHWSNPEAIHPSHQEVSSLTNLKRIENQDQHSAKLLAMKHHGDYCNKTLRSHTQCKYNGESGSEPLMEAKDDMLSSLETAEKFSGAAVRRLFSLKQLLYRPEYERGVRSSGVALPAETRRGTGVMNPVPFPFEWWLLILLLKLFVFLGLGLDPKINSFSLSNKLCSFFWSCNKELVSNYMCKSSCGCSAKGGILIFTRERLLSSSLCALLSFCSSKMATKRTFTHKFNIPLPYRTELPNWIHRSG